MLMQIPAEVQARFIQYVLFIHFVTVTHSFAALHKNYISLINLGYFYRMQSQGVSTQMHLGDIEPTQAKVILLGDHGTGKSLLTRNLDSPAVETPRHDGFFRLIEIPPEELEGTISPVLLKVWEHSSGASKQEEDLAFRGALFCIITLDIRNPDSANSALNKWATLKENLAEDSFLFVVGTFLDQASHRRVDLREMCKACAVKDAIYVEVSNTSLGNITLLRKLIKQRLNYMLYRKEVLSQRAFTPAGIISSNSEDPEDDEQLSHGIDISEEKDNNLDDPPLRRFSYKLSEASHNNSAQGADSSDGPPRSLSVPALEPNILCDSVGSILASHLGTEFWPGMEEEGEELEKIGWKIGNFIEQLSQTGVTEATLATASTALLDDAFTTRHNFKQSAPLPPSSPPRSPSRQASHLRGASQQPNASEDYIDAHYTIDDLRSAFEIMGLSLPPSLDASFGQENNIPAAADGGSRPSKSSSATTYLRKMTVKLPDGTSADMILDLESNIEQQIELFLLSNSLSDDDEARQKLVSIARRVQQNFYSQEGRPSPHPQPYHSSGNNSTASSGGHPRKDVTSPSEASSVAGASGSRNSKTNLLQHIQGSVPFGGNRGHSPVPMIPNSAGDERVSESGQQQQGMKGKKVKLRIGLGDGAFTEVIYRIGESVGDVAEALAARHQLSREQAMRVYEQLSRAISML